MENFFQRRHTSVFFQSRLIFIFVSLAFLFDVSDVSAQEKKTSQTKQTKSLKGKYYKKRKFHKPRSGFDVRMLTTTPPQVLQFSYNGELPLEKAMNRSIISPIVYDRIPSHDLDGDDELQKPLTVFDGVPQFDSMERSDLKIKTK